MEKVNIEGLHHYRTLHTEYWTIYYEDCYLGFISIIKKDGEELVFFNPVNNVYTLEELDIIRDVLANII